jgi:hypothetical protein
MALFVVPEDSAPSRCACVGTSALGAGSIAASTYGAGDIVLTGPVDRIIQSYYMAGPLGRYSPGATSAFTRTGWAGRSSMRQRRWPGAIRRMRTCGAFIGIQRLQANVFVRAIPGATATLGGTALRIPSWSLFRRVRSTARRLRPQHHRAGMGHMWWADSQAAARAARLVQRGLNVYYAPPAPARWSHIGRGIRPRRECQLASLLLEPFRNASADSLDRLGFSAGVGAGSAQNVPYARGSLFFADMDARIRAASAIHARWMTWCCGCSPCAATVCR